MGRSTIAVAMLAAGLAPHGAVAADHVFVRSFALPFVAPAAGFAYDGRRADPILVNGGIPILLHTYDRVGKEVATFEYGGPGVRRGGVAVDAAGGYLALAATDATVSGADLVVHLDAGWANGEERFGIDEGAVELRQDPLTGELFVLEATTNVVRRYSSTGDLLGTLAHTEGGTARGLGLDPVTGWVLLARADLATDPTIYLYAPDGTLVGEHALLSAPAGLRADGIALSLDGRIFLQGDNPENRVWEFVLPGIFTDGFESGDTGAWSVTEP